MKQGILFRILALTLLPVFFITIPGEKAVAQKPQITYTQESQIQVKRLDSRAQILAAYLNKYNSPLAGSAQDFIDAADKNGLDWRLVAAISGVESTFGKHIPGGYNGWGWGVYGDNAIYFNSWKHAIDTISEGLKTRYVDKGLKTPQEMNHVYAASKTWGVRVDYFMNDMDKFAQNYSQFSQEEVAQNITQPKIAGQSGVLASK